MNALSLSITLPTKEAIGDIAMNIVNQIRDGNGNPLELVVQLAAIEKICEMVREGIGEQVLSELDKEHGKTVCLGAKLERKETGTKYAYDGSEAWVAIKAAEDKIVEKRKAVEAIAKVLPADAESSWTDTDTGETLTIIHAPKSSKTSFVITLGK